MKTYLKTLWRTFGKHITRFISIIFIVLVSVGFISGIGTATDKIDYSMTDYYKAKNVSDFIIKSTSQEGFPDDDIAAVKQRFEGGRVNVGMSIDLPLEDKKSLRIYFLDFDDWTVNMPDLTAGEPTGGDKLKVFAERADNEIEGFALGDKFTLDFKEILTTLADLNGEEMSLPAQFLDALKPVTVEVCGILQSPLTFAMDGEPSYNNEGLDEMPDTIGGLEDLDVLSNVLYVSMDIIPTLKSVLPYLPDEQDKPLISTGDIYVAIENRNLFGAFSHDYKKYVESESEFLTGLLSKPDGGTVGQSVEVLTIYDNYSFVSLHSYADKVMGIGLVLMVAFVFVTALVVLSTMTRLLEEERAQVATLKTLGYTPLKILFKYVLFVVLGTGIGGVGAYFVGVGVSSLLYLVFNYSFAMPPVSNTVALEFFLITFSLIVAASTAATLIAGCRMTAETPATLLRPKPPRAGKKVILEKIPFIWNRLSFKYKSTMRNVLRYKSRFIMTVVSVAVSTGLIMAGMGLLDLCLFGKIESLSVMAVALVVIFFAGLLTMVVIYTLTNINISERSRELATLMVLGYTDGEVAGYIYREIYVDTAVGIVCGYPLSALLIWAVFGVMEMGSVGAVTWFWWLVAPVAVLAFTFIVTMILRRKIVNIDMNDSLKAVE